MGLRNPAQVARGVHCWLSPRWLSPDAVASLTKHFPRGFATEVLLNTNSAGSCRPKSSLKACLHGFLVHGPENLPAVKTVTETRTASHRRRGLVTMLQPKSRPLSQADSPLHA